MSLDDVQIDVLKRIKVLKLKRKSSCPNLETWEFPNKDISELQTLGNLFTCSKNL